PHCAVADWQPDGVTLYSSTQAVYQARSQISTAFGVDSDRVRVVCHYMGGGFGSKFGCGHEGILATELSRRARRPVRLVLSRREENLTVGFRTPAKVSFKIGAAGDGRLQAVEASAVMGLGTGGWGATISPPSWPDGRVATRFAARAASVAGWGAPASTGGAAVALRHMRRCGSARRRSRC